MNRKFRTIFIIPLLLAFSAAWTQDAEPPALPEQADDEAHYAAQLPDAAADGLATAAEATMRLMDDDEDVVTNDIELPELPAEAAFGQSVAERAQNGGVDGRDIALEAQEAAEGRGRAEDLPVDVPGRPENVPDGPPDAT